MHNTPSSLLVSSTRLLLLRRPRLLLRLLLLLLSILLLLRLVVPLLQCKPWLSPHSQKHYANCAMLCSATFSVRIRSEQDRTAPRARPFSSSGRKVRDKLPEGMRVRACIITVVVATTGLVALLYTYISTLETEEQG